MAEVEDGERERFSEVQKKIIKTLINLYFKPVKVKINFVMRVSREDMTLACFLTTVPSRVV